MKLEIINNIVQWNIKDGTYSVTERKNKRTLPQNRLYFWYFLKAIVLLFKDLWIVISSEELHEELKEKFLSKRIKSKLTWRYKKRVFSTTWLSTKEFKEYMEKTNEWLVDKWLTAVNLNITENDLLYWETLFI